MSQETIESLLKCLDNVIARREQSYKTINSDYVRADNTLLSSDYDEYEQRKENVVNQANRDAIQYQRKLNELCQRIRNRQPALVKLKTENLNEDGNFPRRVAFGRYHVRYENLDFYVPRTFRFPFEKSMYIVNDSQEEICQLHKMLLRLMYTLPVNKQEYYVFDPIGMGQSVWLFNQLFSNQNLFPQRKIMTTAAELKNALQDVSDYVEKLYSDFFCIDNGCSDWDSYNRRLYSQQNTAKMLPYKIFIFADVPEGMDTESFSKFSNLIRLSKKCGFLVLFSKSKLLENESSKIAQELRRLVDNSLPLYSEPAQDIRNLHCGWLKIDCIEERFPAPKKLYGMLSAFQKRVNEKSGSPFSFNDLFPREELFKGTSDKELSIPCGYTTAGNVFSIKIGDSAEDRATHYLIGGRTGSGKSNLLHNIIVSALWNYAPNELILYLLDFKEGVEFNRYANPALAGIAMVSVETDTEYGISVLEHLIEEKKRRAHELKNKGCNNISEYRKLHPESPMPRILVIIDEFQVLLTGNERNAAVSLFSDLAKQGRSCGIHMILATQTLRGIDFSNIGTQFGGRIALKCAAEDSKLLLGGVTSGNEAAADLNIPYAIVNTSEGRTSANIKFAVPEAKGEFINDKISEIGRELEKRTSPEQRKKMKVFKGQVAPKIPTKEKFRHSKGEGIVLLLGEKLDYGSETLTLKFRASSGDNLILCGDDSQMKIDFLNVILQSALGCEDCEKITYIGKGELPEVFRNPKVTMYENAEAFVKKEDKHYFDKKGIVILDNEDLGRSVRFPITNYGHSNDPVYDSFRMFWEYANENSTHIIAFYNTRKPIQNYGILSDFQYCIGYKLNMTEYNYLLGNNGELLSNGLREKLQRDQRAFLANNQELKAWFRPYHTE